MFGLFHLRVDFSLFWSVSLNSTIHYFTSICYLSYCHCIMSSSCFYFLIRLFLLTSLPSVRYSFNLFVRPGPFLYFFSMYICLILFNYPRLANCIYTSLIRLHICPTSLHTSRLCFIILPCYCRSQWGGQYLRELLLLYSAIPFSFSCCPCLSFWIDFWLYYIILISSPLTFISSLSLHSVC